MSGTYALASSLGRAAHVDTLSSLAEYRRWRAVVDWTYCWVRGWGRSGTRPPASCALELADLTSDLAAGIRERVDIHVCVSGLDLSDEIGDGHPAQRSD